jgi:hypothetical protein
MQRNKLWLLSVPLSVLSISVMMRQEKAGPGSVHFPISCRAETQTSFNHAIAFLHASRHQEAGKVFAALSQSDPSCAMTYWGMAMNLWQTLSWSLCLPTRCGRVRLPSSKRSAWGQTLHVNGGISGRSRSSTRMKAG